MPDAGVRKEALIHPAIAVLQFLRGHVFGLKDRVARVIARPITMKQPAFRFYLAEQRRGGIRSEDVKRGALEAVLFYPLRGLGEDIFAIVVEAEDE
jgi:hypothetical protein